MKGVVFVKFEEFIEELWGDEFWDELLSEADLPSGGAYTTVATYDDQEMYDLIGLVMAKKALTMQQAQQAFGKWLFNKLLALAPSHAHEIDNTFDFLHAVQNLIHVEVKKLNPDALLPEFTFIEQSETELSMVYESPRHLCFLCEGLIHGLAEHTNEKIQTHQSECVHENGSQCIINVRKI